MDAYVTMGTNESNAPHVWVTTIDSKGIATFWESLTAIQYGQRENHGYKKVGCMFNQHSFYGNIQDCDDAEKTKFYICDASKWKCMTKAKDSSTNLHLNYFPIQKFFISDICQKEKELESHLMNSMNAFRQYYNLSCLWDHDIAHLLGICLWSNENAKLYSQTSVANVEFSQGIKKCIPEGHTFKVL